MNLGAPARLGIFAVALGASLGAGLAVGAAVGPVDEDDAPPAREVDHGDPSATTTAVDHGGTGHDTTGTQP